MNHCGDHDEKARPGVKGISRAAEEAQKQISS
jgi:hypothetical protein